MEDAGRDNAAGGESPKDVRGKMKSDREERKPGPAWFQNLNTLAIIAIMAAAALLIGGAIVISGISGYVESTHLDASDKLKKTGVIIFITILSSLFAFCLDLHGEKLRKTGVPEENNGEPEAARGWTRWRGYAASTAVRRFCSLAAVILIVNAILYPFWDDIKLSGVLLPNVLILIMYPICLGEITGRSRRNRQRPPQLPG